jgi:hypothetical protein
MLTMATSVIARKCQNIFLTTYDREFMLGRSWNLTKPGLERVLSVLRLLGLFDRPADEKALRVLFKSPVIPGLTKPLTDLSPSEWRMILARLRRARLLAGEDLHNPGHLDTHPLVREYFGEQLRSHRAEAWKECNRRLF